MSGASIGECGGGGGMVSGACGGECGCLQNNHASTTTLARF